MKFCSSCNRLFMVLIVALLASGIHAQNNNEMIRYRSTPGKGIEVSLDSGKSYIKRNAGLPIRIVYPFSGEEYHALGTIGYDTSQPQRAIIAMDNRLFITQNAGQHWDEISIPEDFNQSAMITAAAISSHNPNQIMIGTSFTGFYESTNGGESWVKVSDLELFDFLRRGAGFSEEISGLAYHPQQADVFYFELGFGGGVFRAEKQNGQVALIENASADDPALYTNRAVLPGDIYRASPMILSGLQRRPARPSSVRTARQERASNKTGIFLNPNQAQPERLAAHIEFMKAHGLNSVVIDFKDDVGWLTYNSQLEIAKEVNSIFPRFDAQRVISTLHENGIYVIARLVVFKDSRLFAWDNNRLALWHGSEDRPWGEIRTKTLDNGEEVEYIHEHWVDGYSEEVWQYNIAIAKELQDLGVDEIQFDYIRFPSDGPVGHVVHRFARPGMRRVDALASFLRLARQELTVPISTDVFGFNAWFRTGYLGQDIETLSEYIDVVCPMSYPSHFHRNFYREMTYFDRAEFIYREGTRRADEMVGESVHIRPYVQAFLIGGELAYEEPEYTEYLTRQLDGTKASPASGFTLWNMSGRYYMVTKSLQPFTSTSEHAGSGE